MTASFGANQLVCRRQDCEGAVCLSLTGEVDLASVATLEAGLTDAAQSDGHVIVDMAELRYIDSSGAKALLDARRLLARRRRRLIMTGLQPLARRIVEVMGLEKTIPVFPTVDAALESLKKDGAS
jgi:anti-sigma B factor antagonist